MRLRYRNVRMLVDFGQSGLDRFHLSFGEADLGVEDPGGWRVTSPGSLADLFDVLSSRSGHGSQWFEIDLRFALDLGPVKVSGATVRATLGHDGAIKPEIRGLDASIVMPGLLDGRGKASLGEGHLDLGLSANIVPLNLGGFASVSYADCNGFNKLVFALGIDLPGPIPLANSGLGLYGMGGIFGVNAALPAPGQNEDPVMFQLGLNPFDTSKYGCARNEAVFGLGAVIGTAPDLGYAFSARAVIVLGLPDFALRASLDGKVLAERVKMEGFGTAPSPGLSFVGLLSIAPDGVLVALRGHFEIPVLFTIDVPFAAYFPLDGQANEWWVHLGSDNVAGRSPGPIQARVLPDLLNVGASAYLMVHGNGLPTLGGDPAMSLGGFALGFGAGFTAEYGVPLVWMELTASVVVGLGTDPFMLAGKGHLAGSLHLGPVSIGASADISMLLVPDLDEEWVKFDVCGEVDLFFFSLEGCVSIEIGEEGSAIPPPTQWPLKAIALSDHLYTKTADAVRSDTQPALADIPAVWPDAIPILQFTTGPAKALGPGPFTSQLVWDEAAVGNGVVGNDRLSYTYFLEDVKLAEINPSTHVETAAAGPYEAAWQAAKGGGRQPGARELALMTWETHLWTRKLLDGAAKHPDSPHSSKSDQCRFQQDPFEGWALGVLGFRQEPGEAWQLPTVIDPDPYASNFVVKAASLWQGTLIEESTAGLFLTIYPLALGGPRTTPEFELPGLTPFTGTFALPHLTGIAIDADRGELGALRESEITTYLAFSEPLFDVELVVALPHWPNGYSQRFRVQLVDDSGSIQPLAASYATFPGPDDTSLHLFPRDGGPYLGMVLTHPPEYAVEIVGLRATTQTAQHNADSATNAAHAAGNQAKTKASSPTAVPRTMLKANTIYRIDVTMSAQGQREGKKAPAPLPTSTERYWFRTPALPGAAGSAGLHYLQGTSAAVAKLHYDKYVLAPTVQTRQDDFDPTYLRRYIASWLPADHSRHWFGADPVGVQLLVSHVPDLALVYRHDITVKVRRLDPTRGNPDPFEDQEFTGLQVLAAAMSVLQPAADQLIYTLTSRPGACPYPIPGGTLGARPQLQPLAQYEVLLAFPYKDGPGGTKIEGVNFGTSRYRTPLELLAALGFGGGGVSGDAKVERIPVAGGDTSADGEIEQTLAKLGLGRWPAADEPRTTALWAESGSSWELHGVLLEAPEPIHRPDTLQLANFGGRVKIDSLAAGGRTFERVMRSSSGDRLLFLTGAPLAPTGALDLAVTLQDIPLEVATVATHSSLSCPITATPAFLGDLR